MGMYDTYHFKWGSELGEVQTKQLDATLANFGLGDLVPLELLGEYSDHALTTGLSLSSPTQALIEDWYGEASHQEEQAGAPRQRFYAFIHARRRFCDLVSSRDPERIKPLSEELRAIWSSPVSGPGLHELLHGALVERMKSRRRWEGLERLLQADWEKENNPPKEEPERSPWLLPSPAIPEGMLKGVSWERALQALRAAFPAHAEDDLAVGAHLGPIHALLPPVERPVSSLASPEEMEGALLGRAWGAGPTWALDPEILALSAAMLKSYAAQGFYGRVPNGPFEYGSSSLKAFAKEGSGKKRLISALEGLDFTLARALFSSARPATLNDASVRQALGNAMRSRLAAPLAALIGLSRGALPEQVELGGEALPLLDHCWERLRLHPALIQALLNAGAARSDLFAHELATSDALGQALCGQALAERPQSAWAKDPWGHDLFDLCLLRERPLALSGALEIEAREAPGWAQRFEGEHRGSIRALMESEVIEEQRGSAFPPASGADPALPKKLSAGELCVIMLLRAGILPQECPMPSYAKRFISQSQAQELAGAVGPAAPAAKPRAL